MVRGALTGALLLCAGAGIYAAEAEDFSFESLSGKWISVTPGSDLGEPVWFTQAFSGYDVIVPFFPGQSVVTKVVDGHAASHVKIVSRAGDSCWYYVSWLNPNEMTWALRDASSDRCPKSALFRRDIGAAPNLFQEAEKAWSEGVKDTNSISVLDDFIRRYKGTIWESLAQERPASLFKSAAAAAPASDPEPSHTRSSFLDEAVGRWAVGGTSNCFVPSKAYRLSLSEGKVIWQTDSGNTDIESVLFSDEAEFRTTTLRSVRSSGSGQPPGTNWIYTRAGANNIQVKPGGRAPFVLSRCH